MRQIDKDLPKVSSSPPLQKKRGREKGFLVLRVQLDNQLLLDVLRDVSTFGHVQKLATLNVFVPFNPRILAVVEACQRVCNYFETLRLLTYSDDLTRFYTVRSNVHYLTINSDVLVVYKLTSCCTSRSDTQAIYNIVKTAFEILKENFTGNAAGCCCLIKHVTELTFKNTICVFSLLLLSKHDTVLRALTTATIAVLAGREITLCENFISTEDSLAETTCDARLRTCIFCHFF